MADLHLVALQSPTYIPTSGGTDMEQGQAEWLKQQLAAYLGPAGAAQLASLDLTDPTLDLSNVIQQISNSTLLAPSNPTSPGAPVPPVPAAPHAPAPETRIRPTQVEKAAQEQSHISVKRSRSASPDRIKSSTHRPADEVGKTIYSSSNLKSRYLSLFHVQPTYKFPIQQQAQAIMAKATSSSTRSWVAVPSSRFGNNIVQSFVAEPREGRSICPK